MEKKIIVLTGATASGKTAMAIELAKKIDARIICADSRIVYKNLDIVSAKPKKAEQQGIVHYLIDIVEPVCDSEFSAGDFVKIAEEKIEEINSFNQNIIITGGTWFYIKSLLDEKALPECPLDWEFRKQLEEKTSAQLWQELSIIDNKRAQLIHPNNKDKIIRSIELSKYLNQPLSEYQRKQNKKYNAVWYMPDLERETIYERINKRVDEMIEEGLFDEWQRNKALYPNSKILKNTIGYKEFFELEEGAWDSFNTAVDKIKQRTRNFAKRQLTYFRSNKDIKLIKDYREILND